MLYKIRRKNNTLCIYIFLIIYKKFFTFNLPMFSSSAGIKWSVDFIRNIVNCSTLSIDNLKMFIYFFSFIRRQIKRSKAYRYKFK